MKLVVIGGYPRSGTSILHGLLRDADHGTGFNFESRLFTNIVRFIRPEQIEVDELWLEERKTVSQKAPYERTWLHPIKDGATFIQEMIDRSWHRTEDLGLKRYFAGGEQAFRAALAEYCIDLEGKDLDGRYKTTREFVTNIFLHCDGFSAADFIVEKTPANLLFAEDIVKIFPSAKFIWIFRHPLDAISSVKSRWNNHFNICHTTWLQRGIELRDKLPPKTFKSIRFENLVEHPKAVLEDVFDWADIPMDGCPIDRLSGTKSNIGRYKTDLTDAELKTLERMGIRQLMDRLDYD